MNHESLMTTLRERRSVRRYKKEPVPMEKLAQLVEAARWAPSAGNSQPWEFLLINDENMINILKTISPGWLEEAPALIIICINKKRKTNWSYIDSGAAMQNILLCADSMGLGCCAIGSFLVPTVTELLEIPPQLEPILFIAVGYPDEKPPATTRLPLEELIYKRVGN